MGSGKARPDKEGDLWQRLAQICVAVIQVARGNRIGADRLMELVGLRLTAFTTTRRNRFSLEVAGVNQAREGSSQLLGMTGR